VLVVINLVAGFQALGTLLAVGLMILPAISARLWARSLGGIAAVATGIAAASGYVGLVLSFWWDLPSGPAIILVAGAVHVVSIVVGPVGGVVVRRARRPSSVSREEFA
jgi:zinc/manganese transport system permease protein